NEPSAHVRLVLASTLHRVPVVRRAALASALLSRGEDANDHNLPKLLWYAISPMADNADPVFSALIAEARIPLVPRFGARRLAEDIDLRPALLDAALRRASSIASRAGLDAIIDGIADALAGRRRAPAPACWSEQRASLSRGANERILRRLRE